MNICLIAASPAGREEICYLVENRRIGAPRLVNGGAENCDGYYAPADRVTEITKSSPLSALSPSLFLPRPTTSVQNSARVCAHGQCSCAIWTLRRRSSERADPRLDSISRVSSVTQRDRIFVVSQFCTKLAAVPRRAGGDKANNLDQLFARRLR